MKRIIVVGAPGCGKTTTARMIATALAIPHIELDSLWWEPNWVEAGAEVFIQRARAVVQQPQWVVDGNYFSVGARDEIWPLADTVVWLDLPRWIAVPRVVRRSVGRSVRGTELWNGNKENLLQVLRPDSIVRFAWTAWPKYGERYREFLATGEFDNLDWVCLRSPREVRAWLTGIGAT